MLTSNLARIFCLIFITISLMILSTCKTISANEYTLLYGINEGLSADGNKYSFTIDKYYPAVIDLDTKETKIYPQLDNSTVFPPPTWWDGSLLVGLFEPARYISLIKDKEAVPILKAGDIEYVFPVGKENLFCYIKRFSLQENKPDELRVRDSLINSDFLIDKNISIRLPCFSPLNKDIYYIIKADDSEFLMKFSLESKDKTALLEVEKIRQINVSVMGHILLISYDDNEPYTLINDKGEKLFEVCEGINGKLSQYVAWSPSGETLCYTRQNNNSVKADLVLFDTNSKTYKTILSDGHNNKVFAWSSALNVIIYSKDNDSLWQINPDTLESKKIFPLN